MTETEKDRKKLALKDALAITKAAAEGGGAGSNHLHLANTLEALYEKTLEIRNKIDLTK